MCVKRARPLDDDGVRTRSCFAFDGILASVRKRIAAGLNFPTALFHAFSNTATHHSATTKKNAYTAATALIGAVMAGSHTAFSDRSPGWGDAFI